MATPDPDSPRRRGRDTHDVPRELGDIDSDGYLVGWIAPDGSCWQSRREHEVAIAPGCYVDAWLRWNRTGGALGAEPDPARFVARYCSRTASTRRCASAPRQSSSCGSASRTAREPPSATDRPHSSTRPSRSPPDGMAH
jgi:hypothetical protein